LVVLAKRNEKKKMERTPVKVERSTTSKMHCTFEEYPWLWSLICPLVAFRDLACVSIVSTSARTYVSKWCVWAARELSGQNNLQEGDENKLLRLVHTFEKVILTFIYHETNGDKWAKQRGWLSDDVNHWTCVGKNEFGLVTCLNLERIKDLEGSLPGCIGQLDNLEKLVAFSTKFSGFLPGVAIAKLNKLQVLRLNNTQIAGPLPSVMCEGLSSLRELWLNDTDLCGPIPSQIGLLSNLEILDLSASEHRRKMNVYGVIPESLCQLKKLKKLWLQRTKITGPLPQGIGNLSELTHFYAFDTNLCGSIPEGIGSCAKLRYLHLSQTSITGSISPMFGQLQNLEELYLSNTNVSGVIPTEFGSLSSLRRLFCDHTNLSGKE
jgi:hypothetical protein